MSTDIISISMYLSIIVGNVLYGLYLRTVRNEVKEIRLWQLKIESDSIKIYVLDDDKDDLDDLKREILCKRNNPYILFPNAQEFEKSIPSGRNIFIIDHFLGQTSGLAMLQKIKDINEHNWVISFAGTNNDQVFTDYVKKGVDRFVYKNNPDFINLLKEAVEDGVKDIVKNNRN